MKIVTRETKETKETRAIVRMSMQRIWVVARNDRVTSLPPRIQRKLKVRRTN